jgi:hypothetical protein
MAIRQDDTARSPHARVPGGRGPGLTRCPLLAWRTRT